MTVDNCSFEVTGLALAGVTHISASVGTVCPSLFTADFTAGVSLKVAVQFWIKMLSAVAIILGKRLVVLEVALWALPVEDYMRFFVELLVDVLDPLLDALEVH